MKTFAVAFIFSLAFHAQLFAQTTSWDYPVKPGSAEWAAFSSRDEMRFACEIPSDILSSVSTETLVELCLNYPLVYDVFAYDNLETGFKSVSNDFNGMRELANRKDNATSLLTKLALYNLNTISTMPLSNIGKGDIACRVCIFGNVTQGIYP